MSGRSSIRMHKLQGLKHFGPITMLLSQTEPSQTEAGGEVACLCSLILRNALLCVLSKIVVLLPSFVEIPEHEL